MAKYFRDDAEYLRDQAEDFENKATCMRAQAEKLEDRAKLLEGYHPTIHTNALQDNTPYDCEPEDDIPQVPIAIRNMIRDCCDRPSTTSKSIVCSVLRRAHVQRRDRVPVSLPFRLVLQFEEAFSTPRLRLSRSPTGGSQTSLMINDLVSIVTRCAFNFNEEGKHCLLHKQTLVQRICWDMRCPLSCECWFSFSQMESGRSSRG